MKKILLAILTIVAFNVNAITFNESTNPELDSVFLDAGQSNVDTTTGLEWLSFKSNTTAYTLGYSINEAASWYDSQGWVVATESQVSNLFGLFFPSFSSSSNGTQTIVTEDSSNLLIQSYNSWILGFGHNVTVATDGIVSLTNNSLYSTGMYLNDNGTVGVAGVKVGVDGLNLVTTLYGPDYGISSLTTNSAYNNLGVFMLRHSRHIDPPAPVVPIPAAIWLFGSGILGLVGVSRRKNIV